MRPVTAVALAALTAALALVPGPSRGADEPAPARETAGAEPGALLSRIDFGNAYVMGQTIKSGAVYLLNRKPSEIRSMLQARKDFRQEIREDAERVDPDLR